MRSTEHLRVPEVKLARAGALGTVLAAVLGAAVTLVLSTGSAAAAVAGGAVLVGLLALVATPLYRVRSAAGGPAVAMAHLGALGLRLVLGVAIFLALNWLTAVPMTPFAVGIALGLVASVTAEMVAAARDRRFFWVDATPTAPAPHPTTGSERQRA